MNQIPRQKLVELVARFGRDICEDARKCEALLRDVCGDGHRREIFVLVSAVKDRVAADLASFDNGIPPATLIARLSKRLHNNLGIAENLASWSVQSWAMALGVLVAEKENAQDSPAEQQAAGADSISTINHPDDPFSEEASVTPEEMMRQAVRRVLADGVVTEQEKSDMQSLRRSLGIAPDLASRIFSEEKLSVAAGIASTQAAYQRINALRVAAREFLTQRACNYDHAGWVSFLSKARLLVTNEELTDVQVGIELERERNTIIEATNGIHASAKCMSELLAKLDRGALIETTNSLGQTPLHVAAHFGAIESVKLLISRGAKVNARGHMGQTPLHHAACSACGADSATVYLLLDRGANSEVKDHGNKTAFERCRDPARRKAFDAFLPRPEDERPPDSLIVRVDDIPTGFSQSPVVVGRMSECGLTVPSTLVSRRHCEFVQIGDEWVVRDLGSRNGTFVNGYRADQDGLFVDKGSRVKLGKDPNAPELIVELPSATTTPVAPDEIRPRVKFHKTEIDHGIMQNGIQGMVIHSHFTVAGMKNLAGHISAFFVHQNGAFLKDTNHAFRGVDENVYVGCDIMPPYFSSEWKEFKLFIPYAELHLGAASEDCIVRVHAFRKDAAGKWWHLATAPDVPFRWTGQQQPKPPPVEAPDEFKVTICTATNNDPYYADCGYICCDVDWATLHSISPGAFNPVEHTIWFRLPTARDRSLLRQLMPKAWANPNRWNDKSEAVAGLLRRWTLTDATSNPLPPTLSGVKALPASISTVLIYTLQFALRLRGYAD